MKTCPTTVRAAAFAALLALSAPSALAAGEEGAAAPPAGAARPEEGGAAAPSPGAPAPAPASGEEPGAVKEAAERYIDGERAGRPVDLPPIFVIGSVESSGVPSVPLSAVGQRDVYGPGIIRNHPARELNDLVKLLPAVSTRPYNGGESAAPSFSIRGLPDDGLTEYLLVLVDGVPISPLPYGWTAPSFAPVATERVYAIDLIRGAHAVRYSPNTVGGVLNLITDPIPDQRTFDFRTTFGTYGYRSVLLSQGDTDGRIGYLATVVDRSGDGYRDDGGFSQQDMSFKFRVAGDGEGDWLQVQASRFQDEHQAPGGLTPQQYEEDRFGNARPDNRFRGWRNSLDIVAHGRVSGDAEVEAFGQVVETARRFNAQRPHFGAPTSYLDWEDESLFWTLGGRGSLRTEFLGLRHDLYGGARVHVETLPSRTIDSRPAGGGPAARTTDSTFRSQAWSAHLDDTIHPVEQVTVTAGARVEWVPGAKGRDSVADETIEHDYFDVLPGVGASWQPVEWGSVFGNWHESFRAPQVWGYDFAGNGQDLDFETGTNMELGLRTDGPGGLSGTLARWWTRFDDVGVYYSGYYENLGRIEADGTDLVLLWNAGEAVPELEGLEFHGSWTHQDSVLKEGPGAGNDTPYAWHDKFAAGVRFSRDGWRGGLDVTYVGGTYSDEANTRAENATGNIGRNRSVIFWDASLGRTIALAPTAELDLSVGVTNLLDAESYVHSRGGFFGGGRVAYAPRQVYATLGLTLEF